MQNNRKEPIIIATLGDLIERRYCMWLHCRDCGRHARADLPSLAARLGSDHPYTDPLPMRCSGCGSRDIAFTIAPDY